jgi:S-DNA-T family DNA segregation ATPase FtsK/SpoIIIE
MTMFLPPGVSGGVGKAFHDLSEKFVRLAKQEPRFQALLEPEANQLEVETITLQMQQLFYELAFFTYLQETIQTDPGKAQALHQLWQGLTGLIRRWAELLVINRRHCSAVEVIPKTFLAQELNVKHSFDLPDGTQQLVQGKFDSLVYDFEHHRLCVVEYKTYQSVDPSAQLAQVSLYGYMLQKKIGVPIDSAVYSVLPDWKELTFTWQQLEDAVHGLIPGRLQQMRQWLTWEPSQPNPPPPTTQPDRLCDICPQQKKCQTFFEVDGSQSTLPIAQPHYKASPQPTKPEVAAPLKPAEVEKPQTAKAETSQQEKKTLSIADGMGKDLVATLQSFGVNVDYQGAAVGPAFIRVKLKPHLGVKVSSILKLSDDLRVQLGLACPPLIAPQAGYVSVDLPRPDRQVASFEHYIQPQVSPPTAPIRIAIGVDLEGKLIEADLSDPNTCHFLVGGTTGSGKSEFLRSLLLSLLIRHSPDQLKIALVDPKRVTFPEFEQMSWLYTPVVKDSDRAIALMTELVEEMDKRYQQFEVAGCADLSTFNQQAGRQSSQLLSRIVCIFDEYADFMAEKETRNALELSIKRLGAMARAAGIHLIIATQRPEARVVTPLIRSNLPGRVALRTASEADSKIVLGGDQIAAAYLLGKGDLLYQTGSQLLRLQSLFASKSVAAQIQ